MTNWINVLTLTLVFAIFIWSCSKKTEFNAVSESDEMSSVKKACLDYVEGWFDSSMERVRSAVHPELIKRIPQDNLLREMTRDELIESAKIGKKRKPEIVVEIFDVFKDIAVAKVTSDFVDYMQLAKIDGQWQVINVLWQK